MDNITLILDALRIAHDGKCPAYSAVYTSNIQPLPHQIQAVYHEMLPRIPLRYVLADDPGAGKTIMAGLFVKELYFRGDIRTCLIVAPGSLADQWQDELAGKFFMDFGMLTEDCCPPLCIARLDTLARNGNLQQKVTAREWDVVIFDEAHKLSAQVSGNDTHYTKRYRLGEKLSRSAKTFLLLTATPHNGKPREFRLFMSLLGKEKHSHPMHRFLKEDLINFDGTPLFPERQALTVSYKLSDSEAQLYEEVSSYVRTQFNRAERLSDRRRGSAVGFALTLLQRRLASSPEAISQSLRNRAERLQNKIYGTPPEYYDIGDTETAADYVSASENAQELQAEIYALKKLARRAEEVRQSGQDVKWRKLSEMLQTTLKDEKIIIFTEHRATLEYLAGKIRDLFGRHDSVLTIHGSMSRNDRKRSESDFTYGEAPVLIATDAAGEGINLQCAHIMVNYDLPWNPNRLEQRFGRIHRIGQAHKCVVFNLIAGNTREGQVFTRLFEKLGEVRTALGGKVFDVLGKVTFGGKSLSDILIEAIRTGSAPELGNTAAAPAPSASSSITPAEARRILQDIQAAKSRMLSQKFIEDFITKALPLLNGSIFPRERFCWEITFVPKSIMNHDPRIRPDYRRVCFDVHGKGELLFQAHPLVRAAASELLRHFRANGEATPEGRKLVELSAMDAVMKIERGLGNTPRDVSADKHGYDILSITPQGTSRFIEVKGRAKGADTVTVTAGEIRFALEHPESFILAIVIIDGEAASTTYLACPFTNAPEPAEISRTYSIGGIMAQTQHERVNP